MKTPLPYLLLACLATVALVLSELGGGAVAVRARTAGPIVRPVRNAADPSPRFEPTTLAAHALAPAAPGAYEVRRNPATREALATRSLRGIVTQSVAGRSMPVEQGRFTLRYWSGATWRVERIQVTDGCWSAPLHEAARLEVRDVFVAGRAAHVESADLSIDGQAEQEIRVRAADPSLLHVRSAASGLPLDRLTIVVGRGDALRPGDSPMLPLGSELPSPLDLDRLVSLTFLSGPKSYWVCAPGHAWGRVTIDHARGGERILSLEQGCALEVLDLGGQLPPHAILRVRSARDDGPEGRPFLEVRPQAAGTTTVAGLPPGRYEVSLEDRAVRDGVLARAEVEVLEAHETVTLEPVAASQAGPLPLTGTLSLPDAWGTDVGPLCLTAEGQPLGVGKATTIPLAEMREGPARVFEWDAGQVRPGRYSAHLRGTGFRTVLDLQRTGEPLRLVVPAPARLAVFIDVDRGAPMPDDLRLRWSLGGGSAGPARSSLPVGSEPLEVIVPAGAVQFDLIRAGTGHVVASRRVDARPGVNRVRLTVQPRRSVQVVLLDGATRIPWEQAAASLQATHLATGETVEGRGGRLDLDRCGLHEVRLSALDGYSAVEPELVQVNDGSVSELVLHLQRVL